MGGVAVTPRDCHAGAGVCKVLLYMEPVAWGCSDYATCLSRRSRVLYGVIIHRACGVGCSGYATCLSRQSRVLCGVIIHRACGVGVWWLRHVPVTPEARSVRCYYT